ncbi:MAG: SPOR domain-containing protein [Armatimonadetes bacterium]|nr:SPOR domain-containing protein [Armatimonadota bacterium]
MKRQSGYGGFPAILLTFSLLLLVLAIGFVVGRVVVARAYLDKAPRLDVEAAQAPDVSSDPGRERSAVPGRVYVPPPAPPPKAPDEGDLLSGAGEEEAGESISESNPPQTAPSGAGSPIATTEAPAPAPASAPEAKPAPAPQPREAAAGEGASEEHAYAIQVGVFTSRQGARQVVDALARSGFSASISPEKRGSQELYRVVTGRYRSEYAARKAVDELRKQGFEAFLIQQ